VERAIAKFAPTKVGGVRYDMLGPSVNIFLERTVVFMNCFFGDWASSGMFSIEDALDVNSRVQI
jgi:hypothetical protein